MVTEFCSGGAVYKLNQLTHSLKAPGFNPRAYKVKIWFSKIFFSSNSQLVPLRTGGNLWNAIRCEQVKVASVSGLAGGSSVGLENVPRNFPLLDVPSIAQDVARALAYLHGAGFAHRDIKSSNVLLAWCPEKRRVQAKLCDFGSAAPVAKMPRRPAKPQWGGLEKLLGFNGRWQPVGTMLWMAPEMLEPPVVGLGCTS